MTDALADPYYSRVDARWSFGERLDPVVWGDGSGPLAPAQLLAYAQYGFLVMPALFDEQEVQAILSEAEQLASVADRTRDDVITEPGSDAVRSLFQVHRGTGALARVARDPRICAVARQVLGSSIYVHQSRINFKPAFEGEPFPWHSDFETWHVEDGMPRMRALSVSVLLTDNTEYNGPLLVLAGSHRVYIRCVGETPADHFRQSLRAQQIGVPDRGALAALVRQCSIRSLVGPAGTVAFFDCNLMHGSGGNISPLPRHNLFVVYNSTQNVLVDPFGRRPARPAFLAEREIAELQP
jgi:ectoine hydroxylase